MVADSAPAKHQIWALRIIVVGVTTLNGSAKESLLVRDW